MGGPVARLTGDRAGRPPRGRQAPGAGWADADELDENVFLLARHLDEKDYCIVLRAPGTR